MIVLATATAIGAVLGFVVAGILHTQDREQRPHMGHTEPPLRVWFWKDGARQKEFHPINLEVKENTLNVTTRDGERSYDPDNYDEITVEYRP